MKDKVIINALTDYVGFLFSYSKDLEDKIEGLESKLEDAGLELDDDLIVTNEAGRS